MDRTAVPHASNGGLYRATWILRAPVLGAALGGVLLTMPPQTQEVYRVLAEGDSGRQLAAALILLGVASTDAWWITRWLTIHLASAEEIQSDSLFGILLRWTPIALGAGLLALASVGVVDFSILWPKFQQSMATAPRRRSVEYSGRFAGRMIVSVCQATLAGLPLDGSRWFNALGEGL
jgi:hypothetical protein